METPRTVPWTGQRKALMSGALAGLGGMVTALADNAVTLAEAALAVFFAAGAYASVFGIKNRNRKEVSDG